MGTNENPRSKWKDTDTIRVTLACGHTVKVRIQPMRHDSKYSCTAGTGCGYSLAWTSWTREGEETVWANRKR